MSTIVAKTTPELRITHGRGEAVVPDPVGLTVALSKLEGANVSEVAQMRTILEAAGFQPGCVTGDSRLTDTEVFQIILAVVEWVEQLGKPAAPTPN